MATNYNLPPNPHARGNGDPCRPAKKIEVLTDQSPMPYGKHGPAPKGAGHIMKDVPPGYLLYIWDVDDGLWLGGPHLAPNQQAVRNYIETSFAALESECPDFNIKHHPNKIAKPKIKDIEPPQFK